MRDKVPAADSIAEGMTAVKRVSLITLVASAVPLACATDCAANPLPARVIVVSALPAARVVGEMPLSVGAGFEMVAEADALALESATLVALTVTPFGDGGASGAV